jgi:hypothetical protein
MLIPKRFLVSAAILLAIVATPVLPAQSGKGGAGDGGSGGSHGGAQAAGDGTGPGAADTSGSGGSQQSSGETGSRAGRQEDRSAEATASPEEDFALWYANDKNAAIRGASEAAVLDIFLPLVREGFPQGLIQRRISEAASKKVAAAQALEAFRRDADDFRFLMERAKAARWPIESSRESFYSDASAALRNGLGRHAVETVFSLSRMVKLDPKRAGAALTAVSALKAGYRVADEDAAALAGALASARIPAKKIPSVLDLAAKARSSGMQETEIISRMLDALKAGGSIADVEKVLFAKS